MELDDRTSLGSVKYNTCLHRLHSNAPAIETLADRASTLTSAVSACRPQNGPKRITTWRKFADLWGSNWSFSLFRWTFLFIVCGRWCQAAGQCLQSGYLFVYLPIKLHHSHLVVAAVLSGDDEPWRGYRCPPPAPSRLGLPLLGCKAAEVFQDLTRTKIAGWYDAHFSHSIYSF